MNGSCTPNSSTSVLEFMRPKPHVNVLFLITRRLRNGRLLVLDAREQKKGR